MLDSLFDAIIGNIGLPEMAVSDNQSEVRLAIV